MFQAFCQTGCGKRPVLTFASSAVGQELLEVRKKQERAAKLRSAKGNGSQGRTGGGERGEREGNERTSVGVWGKSVRA